MRTFLLLLLAACSHAAPPREPTLVAPPPLPFARHGHRIELLADGSLLCFGGFADAPAAAASIDDGERETWRLAPGDAHWRRVADLVHAHAFFGSAVIEGIAYAIGDAVERYDAAADRWNVLTQPGSLPRSHLAACAHDGALWVLGGLPARGSACFRVDLHSGEVAAIAAPPTHQAGDHLAFLFSAGGALHALGGMHDTPWGIGNQHHVLRDGAWIALPPCPRPVWAKFGTCAAVNERHYFFDESGGLCFDAVSGTFSSCAPLPALVAMPAAVTIGNAIWCLGGMRVDGHAPIRWRYDVNTDQWQPDP